VVKAAFDSLMHFVVLAQRFVSLSPELNAEFLSQTRNKASAQCHDVWL